MNNLFNEIKESVRKGEPLFLLSLSATEEEILNANVDELAYIINNRVLHTIDSKPCRCYYYDCGRKGVSLKECHINIRERLLIGVKENE